MQSAPDSTLVSRTRSGDTAAYGELVQHYQTSVFNTCYRLLGERKDAEDLAQEAFIRGFRKLHTFDTTRPFGPWIRKIATHLCWSALQKKRNNPILSDDETEKIESNEINPETMVVHSEQNEVIRQAILSLPPTHRAVIELRHYQDLSYKEISAALDIPLSDVKSNLFRARKSLASELKTYEKTI